MENHPQLPRLALLLDWRLHVFAAVLALAAEYVGIARLPIGIGTLVLLPLLYAFIVALLLNPNVIAPMETIMPAKTARWSTYLVTLSVMPFIAKFGFGIGPKIEEILAAGPALLLQEVGNVATALFALPIAVLVFGMGREAIGATHSVAREPNVALIADKYGLKSPEGIGVMGVYVMGTLFGAIYYSLLSSMIASWNLFDVRALAMGCGVGSGSMMGACAAGLSEVLPEHKESITAFAGSSNLLTYATGLFVSVFIALPFTEKFYQLLSKWRKNPEQAQFAAEDSQLHKDAPLSFATKAIVLAMIMLIMALSNWMGSKASVNPIEAFGGLLIIYLCCLGGILLRDLIPVDIPAIAWISVLGIVLSLPYFPAAEFLLAQVNKVDALPLLTPVLVYAGFAISHMEVNLFKKSGVKIALVALLTFTGTYLGSVLIAQAFLPSA